MSHRLPQTIRDYDEAIAAGAMSLFHTGRAARLYLGNQAWGSPRILYKEFLSRDFWDKPKAILFGSRARRAWRAQQLLESFGFRVPRAIDVLEGLPCGALERSVLVLEYQEDAVSLRQFFPTASRVQRHKALCLLAAEVACMHNFGIAHDDMNLGNILLLRDTTGEFVLLWTDIERIRRCPTGAFRLGSGQVRKNLRQLRKIDVGLKGNEKRIFFRCYVQQLNASKREIRSALAKIVKSGVY